MNVIDRPAARATPLLAQDRQRLTELVEAVCEHRRNALVVCGDELRLELIGVHLARALRQTPQVRMELYLPTSTDSLLARFNAILTDLPLSSARTPVQAHGDLRVWVLHLTQARELPEVQVLMRLVQSFPGAGVRLLLLLSREVADGPLTGLLGGHLHRWWVEEPSGNAAMTTGLTGRSALTGTADWADAQTATRLQPVASPMNTAPGGRAGMPLRGQEAGTEVDATRLAAISRRFHQAWMATRMARWLDDRRTACAQALARMAGAWTALRTPRMAWTLGLGLTTLAVSALVVQAWRSASTEAAGAKAVQPTGPGARPADAAPRPAATPTRAVPEIVEYEDRSRGTVRGVISATPTGMTP